MKNICLCVKIHIPVIQRNYRFIDIDRNHDYHNNIQVENHVKKIWPNSLLPFFETIKNLAVESDGKFRIGVSISGNTLTLLQKFVPRAIELLIGLSQHKSIEFLSEPWSHSVLPFVCEESLIRQIGLHDSLIKSTFDETTDVFIMHSPICPQKLLKTVLLNGKKRIFAYSNHLENENLNREGANDSVLSPHPMIFPINYKLSRLFQEVDFNPDTRTASIVSSSILKKIKKDIHSSNPLTVVYNPLMGNKPFFMNRANIWKIVQQKLLADQEIVFVLPSEMKMSAGLFNTKNQLENPFKLPDLWTKNILQKDAYKKQLAINSLIRLESRESIIKEWDIIQDMEYLFYMNTRFTEKIFAENYFSPFPSPYLAHINYMNVLDDFWSRVLDGETIFNKINSKSNAIKQEVV